jgi:hypothetical protein
LERKSHVIRQAGCLRYLRDHRGVSIIALIIIMAVLGSLGYVFSSLIATKHYSMGMAAPSHQAFYIANSGIEYGIRYASERGWTTGAALNGLDGMAVNLGQGQFTLDYDQPADTLFSTGQVSASQREVALENFTSFVSDIECLELVTSIDPPPISGIPACTSFDLVPIPISGLVPIPHPSSKYDVRFYIRNTCSSQPTITLTHFRATWNPAPANRHLQRIWFDGALKFQGSYASAGGWSAFNKGGNSQDVSICYGARYEGIQVLVRFNRALAGNTTFVFQFRDTNGAVYNFNLGDPPNC